LCVQVHGLFELFFVDVATLEHGLERIHYILRLLERYR
jgi:hypothetical protein